MHIEHIAELDAFQDELARARSTSASGRRANSRGKLLGQVIKKLAGAESPNGLGDNYGVIDGKSARFTNAAGKAFTVNPKATVRTIIFGCYKGTATPEKPLKCKIIGLRFTDCIKYGKTVRGTGTDRLAIRLADIPDADLTLLGIAHIPARLTEAQSVEERQQMEKVIEALTEEELRSMVVKATRVNIRAYVTHAGGELESADKRPMAQARAHANDEEPDWAGSESAEPAMEEAEA